MVAYCTGALLMHLFGCFLLGLSSFNQRTDATSSNNSVQFHDVSRLETTHVNRIVQVHTTDDILKSINHARGNRLKVSIAGARHSQGGQAYVTGGIVLDMKSYRQVLRVDPSARVITIQSGGTWADVQAAVNKLGLAVEVMQSSNIFTIGGSLSVNAHGRDPHYGSMVDSILNFRLLTSDGEIKNVSRQENEQLFQSVIGGYGLFGVILDVDIHLTENDFYEKRVQTMNWKQYPGYFLKKVKGNPKIGLHFAWPTIDTKNLFNEVFVADFHVISKTDKSRSKVKNELYEEKYIAINRFALGLSRSSKMGKRLRWELQKAASGHRSVRYISRNNAMRPEVLFLEHLSPKDTDLLQEYFFPVERYEEFFTELRKSVQRDDINLLSSTIRFVPSAKEPYLRYAHDRTDFFAVVLYFNQKLTDPDRKRTTLWTRHMIDVVLRLGGTYYLTYQRYATRQQLVRAYPRIDDFFQSKQRWDPDSLFENDWYNVYRNMTE